MSGVNAARGEVSLLIDGVERRLCLTLGALAEIETALDAEGGEALGARLRRMSANDLLVVLAALLRGGGEDAIAAALSIARIDAGAAARAIAQAFARATAE